MNDVLDYLSQLAASPEELSQRKGNWKEVIKKAAPRASDDKIRGMGENTLNFLTLNFPVSTLTEIARSCKKTDEFIKSIKNKYKYGEMPSIEASVWAKLYNFLAFERGKTDEEEEILDRIDDVPGNHREKIKIIRSLRESGMLSVDYD